MQFERIIQDHRGKIRIVVKLLVTNLGAKYQDTGEEYRWDVMVWHTPKRKRTETINDSIATPAEIWGTKMNLWEQIKPR